MNDTQRAVRMTALPGLRSHGKVRDIYDLGALLLIVATDRISAFDVVLHEPVPGKGVVLTGLTRFWLELLPACSPHHLEYVVNSERVPAGYEPYLDQLSGRAMVVKKATVMPIECVVRGYLAGGGWREYQAGGMVSGVKLPAGLRESERLPEPIFTPSTKATEGHDQPISFEEGCDIAAKFMLDLGATPGAGRALLTEARRRALAIYHEGRQYAEKRGILIADCKFEFGVWQNQLLLIDEVLTPDSARFWPVDRYEVGQAPPSFDKQFVRDYLRKLNWNQKPPPPALPEEVIAQTRGRYVEACRRLTGHEPAL